MHVLKRSLNSAPSEGVIATIGNFDGVHRGHQALLSAVVNRARDAGLASALMTFEPLPREYFTQQAQPIRLCSLREKVTQCWDLGLDQVIVLPFNAQFAGLSPQAFITQYLQRLNIKQLLVGADFRFGAKRQGDRAALEAAGITVETAVTIEHRGLRISSTWLREALEHHDLDQAKILLGRPYQITGRVRPGAQRGRAWGVPTANIDLRGRNIPLSGVYAVKVGDIPGVANVGTRPSVDGTNIILEVHLLDFDQDLYQKIITIDCLKKLRDEIRFDNIEKLKHQIYQDIGEARIYHGL